MTVGAQLQARYLAALGDRLGLDCHVEAGGFLTVDVGDRECFILLDAYDPALLRFGTAEVWPPGTERSWATAAAERVNRRCPGVKATLAEDKDVAVLAVEMIVAHDGCLPNKPLLVSVVDRMTRALVDAARVFSDDLVLSRLAAT